MCKHTKCCLNNSKDRENIIIYKESLIMWIFPQGADISEAVQGQGCCFFLKGTLNTCHCQTSCNLRLQTRRPPKKKRRWWGHSTDILIACFFQAGPICIKIPSHGSLALNWRWPGNLRRIPVWHVPETHRCMLFGALLSNKRASQGAAV